MQKIEMFWYERGIESAPTERKVLSIDALRVRRCYRLRF